MATYPNETILAAALAARAELDTLINTLQTKPEAPPPMPVRSKSLAVSYELIKCLHGPIEAALNLGWSVFSFSALSAVLEFDVLRHVPAAGQSPIDNSVLAAKVGLGPEILYRLLSMIATHDAVKEVEQGRWQRTEISEVFLHPAIGTAAYMLASYWGNVPGNLGRFLRKQPNPKKSNECTYSFMEGRTPWQAFEEDPELAKKFSLAMEGFTSLDDSLPALKRWIQRCGRPHAKFVDVGGANGHMAISLAKALPDHKFEVQDITAHRYEQTVATLPEDLKPRLSFTLQNFFEPQPQLEPGSVSAYLLRRCLHDWSDEDAAKILAAFVPALERDPGCVVLINDTVLPPWGKAEKHEIRGARNMDMVCMNIIGSLERSADMWMRLVKGVDSRLEVVGVTPEEGGTSGMCLIEVRLMV